MLPASNTPPDGDFARYVEELTRSNALAASRPDLRKLVQGEPAAAPLPTGTPAHPSVKAVLPPLAARPAMPGRSFATHLKWVLAAWIGTQVLARIIPGAGFLFVPALLVYAAWGIFRVNRPSSGAWMKRFREWADAIRNAA